MTHRELEMHLLDLFEGRIEKDALSVLQRELRENPEARLAYRDQARLQNALQIRAEGRDPLRVIPMDLVNERRQKRSLRYAAIAAAAIVVLVAGVMAFQLVRTPLPTLTFATSPGTKVSLSAASGEDDEASLALEPGSRLEVLNGTVELNFASGVRGIVRGPADLTLHRDDLLYLSRGTAWFEVPEKAVGFMVNTPDFNLTDLGTEFGIISRPEFLDEVHVFDGKVEVTNRHGLKETETLVGGQARVAGPVGRWKEAPLRPDPFLTVLPEVEPDEFAKATIYDDFDTDSSAEYVCIEYTGGGLVPERFSIDLDDNGVLEIATGGMGQRGAQVVHRSGRLEPEQSFRVDWLTPAQSGYAISQVLTATIDSTARRYCVRCRVNDGGYVIDFERGHGGEVEWFNKAPYTAPETFWIDRKSATEFSWFRGSADQDRIKIAEIRFDSDPGPLLVGVQTWATTAQFDNLAIIERVAGEPVEGLRELNPEK